MCRGVSAGGAERPQQRHRSRRRGQAKEPSAAHVGERSHGCRPQISRESRARPAGWASTDLRPDQPARSVPQFRIIPGGGSRRYPGERREWAAVPARRPHPSDVERAIAKAPVAQRRRAAAQHPQARLPAARPRCTRRSRSLSIGTKPAAGGASEGADDEPEGQAPCGTRVGAAIVVLLVLAWAAGWFGRRPAARGADAITRR